MAKSMRARRECADWSVGEEARDMSRATKRTLPTMRTPPMPGREPDKGWVVGYFQNEWNIMNENLKPFPAFKNQADQ